MLEVERKDSKDDFAAALRAHPLLPLLRLQRVRMERKRTKIHFVTNRMIAEGKGEEHNCVNKGKTM